VWPVQQMEPTQEQEPLAQPLPLSHWLCAHSSYNLDIAAADTGAHHLRGGRSDDRGDVT
jgi:hypothetical protein